MLKTLIEAARQSVAIPEGTQPNQEVRQRQRIVEQQIQLVKHALSTLKSLGADIEALRVDGGTKFEGTSDCDLDDDEVTLDWPNLSIMSDEVKQLLDEVESSEDVQASQKTTVVYTGHLNMPGADPIQIDFDAPKGASQDYLDKAFMDCLAQIGTVEYLAMGEIGTDIWFVLYGDFKWFRCDAESREHALEQCKEAHPGETMHTIVPFDPFWKVWVTGNGEDSVDCPKCGSRTKFGDLPMKGWQVHVCQRSNCQHSFIAEPDEEETPA